jgi:hypothetical protein
MNKSAPWINGALIDRFCEPRRVSPPNHAIMASLIFVWIAVREIKGKTLEEI